MWHQYYADPEERSSYRDMLRLHRLMPDQVATYGDYYAAYQNWSRARPDSRARRELWKCYCVVRDSYLGRVPMRSCYHPLYAGKVAMTWETSPF